LTGPDDPNPVLTASKNKNLLNENFGNKKFWLGNHRYFLKKLGEQEIPIDGPGPVGLNAELCHRHSEFIDRID